MSGRIKEVIFFSAFFLFCLLNAAFQIGHKYGQRGADRWYAEHATEDQVSYWKHIVKGETLSGDCMPIDVDTSYALFQSDEFDGGTSGPCVIALHARKEKP